jgi:hypothetical protein
MMAIGSGLVARTTDRHLAALRSSLGEAMAPPVDGPADALGDALAGELMDIAYLYSHGVYDRVVEGALPSTHLLFGGERIGPLDISKWARSNRWPDPHWASRKPLVVINGCHTAELTSATLANFVGAFVGRAGASGMIGTEVGIDQRLAGPIMERFLSRFVAGTSVGAALRATRWDLLSLGNVMGLAYTPYCLSGLKIRATDDPRQTR